MKFKDVNEKIEFLKVCSDAYENGDKPLLSDIEYDKLFLEAKSEKPDDPFFNTVGYKPNQKEGETIKHQMVMGSLNKSRDILEYRNWVDSQLSKFKEKFLDKHFGLILQPKVDGVAVSLYYAFGRLQFAATRGDGEYGIDITRHVELIDSIPKTIPFARSDLEIRGEIYKDRIDFYKNWVGKFANPRNFTSGTLFLKDYKESKKRSLSFVAYDILGLPFTSEILKLNWLNQMKFPTILEQTGIAGTLYQTIVKETKQYMDNINRNALDYAIDGIVVKVNDVPMQIAMGSTADGKYPNGKHAIKFPAESKDAILLDVIWQIGRSGKLTPVGKISPIELMGSTITKVSLHNLNFILENKLEIGDVVVVQKSGDIIPYLVRNKSGANKDVFEFKTPAICPSCNNPLIIKGYDCFCDNPDCGSILNKRIEYFFKTIGIKGIGSKFSEALVEVGVEKISDVYELLKDYKSDLIAGLNPIQKELESKVGETNLWKFYKSIFNNKPVKISKFIEALGIGHIKTSAKRIVAALDINSVNDLFELKRHKLSSIKDIGFTKSDSFMDFIETNQDEILELDGFINIIPDVSTGKLQGTYCFTGSFSNPTRKEMEQMVVDNGGELTGVTKNLTALIWDEEIKGSKINKAKNYGINIINQKQFLSLLGD